MSQIALFHEPPERPSAELCKRLEHFETPAWSVKAILSKEILTAMVVDPCTGTGVLAKAAIDAGYSAHALDIQHWGYSGTTVQDFLTIKAMWPQNGFTILMNPPFSKACEFVEKALELGARKVVCFQRFAWWESASRREFWETSPPARVYVCGDRATCWRHDLPTDENGKRLDPVTGKRLAGTTTAHAWFVWEQGAPAGTLLSHIYKGDVE